MPEKTNAWKNGYIDGWHYYGAELHTLRGEDYIAGWRRGVADKEAGRDNIFLMPKLVQSELFDEHH